MKAKFTTTASRRKYVRPELPEFMRERLDALLLTDDWRESMAEFLACLISGHLPAFEGLVRHHAEDPQKMVEVLALANYVISGDAVKLEFASAIYPWGCQPDQPSVRLAIVCPDLEMAILVSTETDTITCTITSGGQAGYCMIPELLESPQLLFRQICGLITRDQSDLPPPPSCTGTWSNTSHHSTERGCSYRF